jgi:nucleotide-binding universal stress UspA family protein
MYHRILVATDASPGSLKAVTAAAELAVKLGAALVALHIYEASAVDSALLGGGMINGVECLNPKMLDTELEVVNHQVREKTEVVLNAVGAPYTYRQEIGLSAANVIVKVAQEESADLIVLGSRGLNGIEAFLLGSVSERVAHRAPCSVLIVR